MNTYAKLAAAAGIAAAMALSTAVPSQAATRHGHHYSDSYRAYEQDTYGVWPGYGDAGYDAYAASPSRNSSDVNERQCMLSPGSQGYVPCFNH